MAAKWERIGVGKRDASYRLAAEDGCKVVCTREEHRWGRPGRRKAVISYRVTLYRADGYFANLHERGTLKAAQRDAELALAVRFDGLDLDWIKATSQGA